MGFIVFKFLCVKKYMTPKNKNNTKEIHFIGAFVLNAMFY